ncbi:MAG TPA: hypothetical protein VNW90_09630 [Acetobacteraceae bacterium]|nr:hypothetical protein [Acetobacteraceae bacterium]
MLAGACPVGSADDRRNAARATIEALKPRDIIEGMLAARMIAAHHATMDGYQRAMQPGVSDAEAIRLRSNAIAAARSFDAALRTLEKRRAGETAAKPHRQVTKSTPPAPLDMPESEADAPLPSKPRYVPRNKNGEPIELWRWEDMTMAQRRAAYGDPDNAELRNVALAEEAAMIEAEQRGGD